MLSWPAAQESCPLCVAMYDHGVLGLCTLAERILVIYLASICVVRSALDAVRGDAWRGSGVNMPGSHARWYVFQGRTHCYYVSTLCVAIDLWCDDALLSASVQVSSQLI